MHWLMVFSLELALAQHAEPLRTPTTNGLSQVLAVSSLLLAAVDSHLLDYTP